MNWQIQITKENREEFREWHIKKRKGGGKAYNINSWYCHIDGNYDGSQNKYDVEVITWEYFLQNIKNEKLEYVIF